MTQIATPNEDRHDEPTSDVADQTRSPQHVAAVQLEFVHRAWQFIIKSASIAGFFALWAIIYDVLNQRGADPSRSIYLARPVDRFPGIIQAWTAPIYVFGGIFLAVLPFAYYRTWARLRFVLCCYAFTSLLAFGCYWVWPLAMIRPEYRGGHLGEYLMREVFRWDRAANCFPSSHVFFAVLSAVLVSRGGASVATTVLTWLLAVAVCATTLTTGQHYFIDVPSGVIAALLGYAGARRLRCDGGRRG